MSVTLSTLNIFSKLYTPEKRVKFATKPIQHYLPHTLGHPSNFNGFRVLDSLLHPRLSTEINQALHDVSPSPGLIHFWVLLSANGILPGAKFTLRPILVFSYTSMAALLHGTRAVGISQTLRRGTRNGITELASRHYVRPM